MFDPIEEVIKGRLGGRRGSFPKKGSGCPSEEQLWDYLNGTRKAQEKRIASHIILCHDCLDSLLLAQEVRPGIGFGPSEGPRDEVLAKAIDLAKKKPRKTGIRRHIWLILSVFFIALSFFISRYFVQCLVLGVLFGFKWVFDTATTRTLIVMYEALRKTRHKDEASQHPALRDREENKL